jgi:hypothetical protein
MDAGRKGMNARRSLVHNTTILPLLALCLLGCNSIAAVSADLGHEYSASPDRLSVPAYGIAAVYPWQTIGLPLALSDFDGDHKIDFAVSRRMWDGSAIVIHLSSRPDETVLEFSHLLASVAVFAYDINKDSFPDVVVASPFDVHPLAVWLGDGRGSFIAADQTHFANSIGFKAAPSYDRKHFALRQDLLSDPRRLDCEHRAFATQDLKPEPEPSGPYVSFLLFRREDHPPLGPRSPPDPLTL